MPVNIVARAVIMTKMASGTVQVVVQSSLDGLNPNGDLQFVMVIPAADFTSFNTTVNGGAAGATLTKVYAENLNSGDYPLGFSGGI
jgi:ABC-type dipeptide/oligopeptide/nickel transport system ATPase subunit